MEIHFTARRFKTHKEVRNHAYAAVKRLHKFYDGIIRADIILSYERDVASIKTAEINLHVHGAMLTAKEPSEDFSRSIDSAVEKLERQLAKHKTKEWAKDKKTLRRVKESTSDSVEKEE